MLLAVTGSPVTPIAGVALAGIGFAIPYAAISLAAGFANLRPALR